MEGATAQRVVARARDRGMLADVAIAVAIAVLAWPVRSVEPDFGGDWSWVAALAYAAQHGLPFGGELAFTYGPLGFLDTAYGPVLYDGGVLLASWLFAALVQLLLAGTLLLALRRRFPLPAAAALAFAVLALTPDRVVALGFAWCALAIAHARDGEQDALPPALARALPFALGALTGIALLGKLNHGVELLALAAIALLAAPRRRDALAFGGTLAGTALLGWLLAGQALGDLWPYVRYGAEVIAGYGAAMGTVDPEHRWVFAAFGALAAFALGLAWDAGRETTPRLRWGLVLLCGVYLAAAFKEGFVRMDEPHLESALGDLLVLFALLPLAPSRRPLLLGGIAGVVVATGALVAASDVVRAWNPVANVAAAGEQVATIASASRQREIGDELRGEIAATYQVGPELLEAIGERPVMLWPFLYGDVAWAYGLHLRPLPTLEPYAAYTPALDRLGARMLASEHAPARILRAMPEATGALDARAPAFEAPLATLEILCRYRPLAVQPPWHVLARGEDRCGPARAIATTTAAWGEPVDVPAAREPDALVLARVVGAEPRGAEALRALVLRPQRRWVELDGAQHRLVAATAADGLLLSAPVDADYPAPFAMAPNARRIAVGRDGGQPGGELRYAFVEVPIEPLPPAP